MMKDYGFDSRQNLIATTFDISTLKGRRDAYRFWISRGHSEQAASRAAGGYHPIDEWEDDAKLFSKVLVVLCVLALLFLWANSSAAVVENRSDLKDARVTESALVDCMNGEVMRFSDGSRWACVKLGEKK